jgi:hypothetical protein
MIATILRRKGEDHASAGDLGTGGRETTPARVIYSVRHHRDRTNADAISMQSVR